MALQMGYDVKIKAGEVGIDDINFVISGQAVSPQQQQMQMMGGGGMMPPMGGPPPEGGGEEGNGGGMPSLPEPPIEKSMGISKMITEQLKDLGYEFPIFHAMQPNFVIFDLYGEGLHKADIKFGKVTAVNKYVSPRMHRHPGAYTYHDINTPHNNTLDRKPKSEENLWEAEEPDGVDFDV